MYEINLLFSTACIRSFNPSPILFFNNFTMRESDSAFRKIPIKQRNVGKIDEIVSSRFDSFSVKNLNFLRTKLFAIII